MNKNPNCKQDRNMTYAQALGASQSGSNHPDHHRQVGAFATNMRSYAEALAAKPATKTRKIITVGGPQPSDKELRNGRIHRSDSTMMFGMDISAHTTPKTSPVKPELLDNYTSSNTVAKKDLFKHEESPTESIGGDFFIPSDLKNTADDTSLAQKKLQIQRIDKSIESSSYGTIQSLTGEELLDLHALNISEDCIIPSYFKKKVGAISLTQEESQIKQIDKSIEASSHGTMESLTGEELLDLIALDISEDFIIPLYSKKKVDTKSLAQSAAQKQQIQHAKEINTKENTLKPSSIGSFGSGF